MVVHIDNQSSVRVPKKFLIQNLKKVFNRFKKLHPELYHSQDINLIFLNPQKAKELNLNYRKKNYPTDVLSFPGQGPLLGELIFCSQVLKRQAIEQGHSFQKECLYMAIHGFLHLKGFDHETTASEAEKMFSLQNSLYTMAIR
jgi:probable rRNA maturation factor